MVSEFIQFTWYALCLQGMWTLEVTSQIVFSMSFTKE